MSGFLPKNVALFNLSSSEAADWSIFRVDWEHRVALSCSVHSKEIVSFLAGYGFASMQQQQKGLEMTSVDSKWWLTCLWRVDTSLNAVKSQLTWQSQLMCSLNQSTPEIHNNLLSKTQYSTCSTVLICLHSTGITMLNSSTAVLYYTASVLSKNHFIEILLDL